MKKKKTNSGENMRDVLWKISQSTVEEFRKLSLFKNIKKVKVTKCRGESRT